MQTTKLTETEKIERDIERAANSYKRSDDGRWVAAYFSSRVVGRYELGATIALANRMGRSSDTVENLAHAYAMYSELRAEPKYRRLVRNVRKMPFIYYSYFRALYKARQDYGLTLDQVMSILIDMVQAEGSLSQRDLDQHIIDRFGDSRNWQYYGSKAMKEIHKTLQQPDLPKEIRDVLIPAYERLGDKA